MDAVERREYASKKAQLAAAELAKLSRRVCDNQTGKSFISYITAKILDSIQVSIRNVHVLYRDTLSAKEHVVFGLKFSSLTITRQTAAGSSSAKLRGGQVNKLIEVQNLELYYDTFEKTDDSNTENVVGYKNMGRELLKEDNYSSLLAPLNVSVSLSVNRSGKLLNDAPQYNMDVELARVTTLMDEVQLQQILSLCDYMSLSRLREKYGRYRPWWSPIGKRLKGWQKLWWHYAQKSVLSDVRKSLRKTSWKYLGERLNSRRKYVNLYKAKLKCLRHDQVVEEDVQHILEEMEKETDIDDILNYRSVAECELEDFLVNPASRYGSNDGNADIEDDHPPTKPRGWLNWLSYGMLGAGGTNDSNQFSGVISDDVIKDIYEATKFHPAPALIGDSAMVDEVYFSSVKINISEIHTRLLSMELGGAIADLTLHGIYVEGKVWEKSATITTFVNSAQLLNPCNNLVALSTEKVNSEDIVLEKQQPFLNVKIDLSPPSGDVNSSVKVIVSPIEVFCDSEFVKNILDFLYMMQNFSFHQQRILLSLNDIDNTDSRFQSKIDYVLSSRKKMIWDINLINTVVKIPCGSANTEEHNMVIEVATVCFTSKTEIHYSGSHVGDRSGSIEDTRVGFQIEDLYDHFGIQINDAKINLMMSSSATFPLLEKFSATADLVSCILPDEPILKGLEVRVQVQSLYVHFSASIYGELMGFVKQFNTLLPPSNSKASLEPSSNVLQTSVHPWFSIDVNMDAVYLLVNLEESVADGCTLNLHCQNLAIWYDQRDFPECWASVETCRITASSPKDDFANHVLCSTGNMLGSESLSQCSMGVNIDGPNRELGPGSSIVDGCIVLHLEALRNTKGFLQQYTIYAKNIDIHCYPLIVGKLVRFSDNIVVYGESDIEGRKPGLEDENSWRHGFEAHDLLDEIGSYESSSIPLNHFPVTTSESLNSLCNKENIVEDMRLRFSRTLHLRGQKFRDSNFSCVGMPNMLSAPLVNCNNAANSSAQDFIDTDMLLVNLNLQSITVHFHDSSWTLGTILVPFAKSLCTISSDSFDIVSSTEGVVLSIPWQSQIINEFLWGPLYTNLSPILNLHLKKTNTGPQTSQLEMSFSIRQVSCILPSEVLAIFISYFSQPDWNPGPDKQPTSSMRFEDSSTVTYNFEIVDCNVITPANSHCSEYLKANITQLRIAFSENNNQSSVIKDIPSACCIGAGKLCDRNHCLDFFGVDLSLSLLLEEEHMVGPLNGRQNLVLIPSLSADVWVRIPVGFEADVASSYPVCIMAMVNDIQIDVAELCPIAGFSALGYVIDQFSMVDEASKIFTSDLIDFEQAKKQMMEYAASLPKTSDIAFSDMRFCVSSLSLRLHRSKRDSICSEMFAAAEMHFVCSLSLGNGKPPCFDISFSSLALFSFINSVLLAEFACPGSGSSVLDVILSVSDHGENRIVVSFPCLEVWLYLFDWNEVVDLVSSLSDQLSILTSGASETVSGIAVDNSKYVAGDNPNQFALESDCPGFSTLTLENIGMTVHFPALVSRDRYNIFGRPNFHDKQPLDECCSIAGVNQNCFLSFNLQSRNTELATDGKTVKLTISSGNLNGIMKLYTGNNVQSWPLFQLSKIYLEAEILKYQTENVHMSLLVRCDSLDLSISNHILYLFHFTWFAKSEETPSQFKFKRMDIKVQLRKFSLLLTDWKGNSNGPLLEFLLRNSYFWSTVIEDEIEGSVGCDFQVNYYSIDKVLWEPFLEPWKFQLSMSRKQDENALFSGAMMSDINLESKTNLNLNLNESIIEVVSRANEMIKDAWSFMETESSHISSFEIMKGPETRRYAPYMLQNLTTVPLVFCVCQRKLGADDLDVSPSKGVLQPGSSTLVYINESPEDLLFRYRPVQSSDKLNDNQLLEAAHRYVTFQLEGTSVPSAPISMDLVGRRYFEVEFSKSSHVSEIYSDVNSTKRHKKVEGDGGTDAVRGFAIPVVIDVSVQRFTKLMRLYSTVVILNSTSLLLEVRFDIPFGIAPKILGPIYPGQEFPLPLHLAEAGCIRCRPLGDSHLWSEAYNISSIISQDVRIGFLRSFVCYPSHPSSDAFRCCISVNDQCLPPVGRMKGLYLPVNVDRGKQSHKLHNPSSNSLEIPRNRFLYQVMLTSPLVLKNYLMKSMSVTLEDAGVSRTAFLSEIETSFYHIDSSHDLLITFHMHGFKPSTLKYLRAESFSEKAKFSGTKFSISEIIKFDPDSSDGPLYVTMEKVMDAVSGAREILISVPFLLYNCTGFSLALSTSVNEMKEHNCVIPSCYNLDELNVLVQKKDGLGLICTDQKLPSKGSTSGTDSSSPDFAEIDSRKVNVCLFSPDPHLYSGEVMVKLSRYLPSVMENFPNLSWSNPFSLVPSTGSTSVLVPQPSIASGYVLSVSATTASFSGRTKMITFQPRYVIANACSKNLCYKQKGTDSPFVLGAGKHSHIRWMDTTRELLLSVRFDEPGWEWSGCFLPEQLGDTQVKARNYLTTALSMMCVEVRSADISVGEEKIVGSTSGNSGTNLILLSDDETGFMPYRIDNNSRERLRIYQQKCESFETAIHPYTSSPYAWDEPCYPRRLIVEVPGERILGSYAIDDASVHSLVYLSATSEKPERNLLISVHSEGAIKVLSIIDSSYHVLNDLKSLHVPQLKDKGKQTQKYESFINYKERFSVEIPFLGVSLMNSRPEELLFACAKHMKINFVQSLDQQQFSLQIASLQIDNQLRTTPYPVILSFNRGNKGIDSALIGRSMSQISSSNMYEPVFSLAVAKWRNSDRSLVSFESIILRIADFHLEIEQEIVLRLFEFCKTTSSRLQSRGFQRVDSTSNLLFPDSDFTDFTLLNDDQKRSFLLPQMVPIGAPWQQIELATRKQNKIYVESLDMGTIKLTLSFSSSPWILRNGVLTSGESLIHRGLMALADVEGAKINFKQLLLSHQIASWESIQEILVSHYTRQFLHEMYKVFGSAGLIGNPVGFARSLGLGIKDFFSLPMWSVFQSPAGLMTGMAQGTMSLLSNTVYAVSDATSQFSKAAHKGIVAFTFDDQTAIMVDRQQKGMPSHSKGVINEFLEGLTGVLQSPIKGAEKHGLPGVLSGIAVGVTGLVAKPAASILEVTGKTAQSIRNRSRIHQMGYRCLRVRLPRPLSAESPLKPYSWEEAIGTFVLAETDMKLREETLIMCKALKQCGQYVLITRRLIVIVGCSSLVELGKPNFEGVPSDPKWVIESEIGMDGVILADNDGEVVHIVGSGSDTSFRQNLQGNEAKGKLRHNFQAPLPLLQTNLEFNSSEEADEFLRVLRCMIELGKEQGWGSLYILHQSKVSSTRTT
ncbi:hypothetical protein ACP275_12G059000 [Erythranthe tilingii]